MDYRSHCLLVDISLQHSHLPIDPPLRNANAPYSPNQFQRFLE
jgi:hypothetical protein